MKKRTNQELFDASVAGLAKQGFKQSISTTDPGNKGCAYRGGGGVGCAIGVLIPPKVKIRSDHNTSGVTLLPERFLTRIGIDKDDSQQMAFVKDLQSAHDNADLKMSVTDSKDFYPELSTPERMQKRLIQLANQYGLTLPKELL